MTNPSNISDDADFLLSLVPFLDAHHVRTDRIEAIANRLRVMPTEATCAINLTLLRNVLVNAGLTEYVAPIRTALLTQQSTLLKEG